MLADTTSGLSRELCLRLDRFPFWEEIICISLHMRQWPSADRTEHVNKAMLAVCSLCSCTGEKKALQNLLISLWHHPAQFITEKQFNPCNWINRLLVISVSSFFAFVVDKATCFTIFYRKVFPCSHIFLQIPVLVLMFLNLALRFFVIKVIFGLITSRGKVRMSTPAPCLCRGVSLSVVPCER